MHREALATVQYTATHHAGDRPRAVGFVRGARTAMTPFWGSHAYVNYADPSLSHYRQAYFGANAAHLAQVAARWDPDGFFTQPQDFSQAEIPFQQSRIRGPKSRRSVVESRHDSSTRHPHRGGSRAPRTRPRLPRQAVLASMGARRREADALAAQQLVDVTEWADLHRTDVVESYRG